MIAKPLAKDLIERLTINPFIDGPTEALVKAVALSIATTPEWRYIFSDNIDTYERIDYSFRQLPALRVYNQHYRKMQESHYIEGELVLDILLPASLRRDELQGFQDVLSSAMMQQFRRPNKFAELVAQVPGLNELGKVFDVDKTLGLMVGEGACPLLEMKPNFRIDLKRWDDYLESTGRTKEDPFNVTLKNLVTVAVAILPVREDGAQGYIPEPGAQQGATVTIEGEE